VGAILNRKNNLEIYVGDTPMPNFIFIYIFNGFRGKTCKVVDRPDLLTVQSFYALHENNEYSSSSYVVALQNIQRLTISVSECKG
jgi:hypothetical protein